MSMQKITIKKIAKLANISTATVSRAINNPELVAEETRHKVMEILHKYDYTPNHLAKGLVSGKSQTLSLLTPKEGNFFNAFYFRETFLGITVSAASRGYNILIDQSLTQTGDIIKSRFPVDGYIIVSPSEDDPFVKKLEEKKFPAVLVNRRSSSLSWVDLDNQAAAEEAVNYLIDQGHTDIVAVAGKRNVKNSCDRLQGYKSALKVNGILYNEKYVIYGDFSEETTYIELKKLLTKNENITAVFAFNDLMAIGAMKAIRESGKKLPRDISVVGFDDMPPASYMSPSLTTIRQPFYLMGYQASRFLIDIIEKKDQAPLKREFEGELVLRGSAGPVLKK